jgi:2-oxoglutarate ferredoxin oxidoreductase subunit beta
LTEAHDKQHFITGLLYVNGDRPNLAEVHALGETPLAHFQQDKLRPSRESLTKIVSAMY